MPGLLLHAAAPVLGSPTGPPLSLSCFHQMEAKIIPTQVRVWVSGYPVATALDQIVVGPVCPFQVPTPAGAPKPQPCVTVKWANLSTRILIQGQPAMLQAPPGAGVGAGVCQSVEQIPQGLPTVKSMQVRVMGI